MSDRVTMTSKTVFHNPRVQNDKGGLVEVGDTFETDAGHARDLERLRLAEPAPGALDAVEPAPLEPHFQVSEAALRTDRQRRRVASKSTAPESDASELVASQLAASDPAASQPAASQPGASDPA